VKRTERRIDPTGLERHLCQRHGDGERRSTVDQPCALFGRRSSQRRLEQLADDAEGELVLKLSASRREREKATVLRLQPYGASNARLPDAGRSLHDDQSALTRPSTLEQRSDPDELRRVQLASAPRRSAE
jgi:hypothetical protein